MWSSDPVAGPGPSTPAVTGIPVSATVGVITGTVVGAGAFGEPGGKTAAEGGDEVAGISAGELLRVAGSSGGDWVF